MARFYFHLFNGLGSARDEEGREAPSLEAARSCAVEDIRSIISGDARAGVVDLAGWVEIADERGRHLATVRFEDAVELKLPKGGA